MMIFNKMFMNYWIITTYILLAIVGFFTWWTITYKQPILTDNMKDCIEKGGVYHLRLNDSDFSDLEYCNIENKIHYQ